MPQLKNSQKHVIYQTTQNMFEEPLENLNTHHICKLQIPKKKRMPTDVNIYKQKQNYNQTVSFNISQSITLQITYF